MRNRNPQESKIKDLRRIARGRSKRTVFGLFDKYNPEIAKWKYCWCLSLEWSEYYRIQDDWAARLAGHWSAIGGAPPSSYRRMYNRLSRARQKDALRKAIQNDDLDNFCIDKPRRTIRCDYY